MEPNDIPQFDITPEILSLILEIDRVRSSIPDLGSEKSNVTLRRRTNIRSIDSSLAIEGNELGLEKVIAIVNGKDVIGPYDDIIEVQNAIKAYEQIGNFDPYSLNDFIEIGEILTFGLVESSGLRDCNVAVFEGDEIRHKAPNKDLVEPMLIRLFEWGAGSAYPSYINAAVIHYYIEYIHPFTDGNGRMGRLWHTAILCNSDDVFKIIPLESKIYSYQNEYYEALQISDEMKNCTEFIRFCLRMTLDSLKELSRYDKSRVAELLSAMGDESMTSAEIMKLLDLSSRENFLKNYIRPAIGLGLIVMTHPNSPNHRMQRYRRVG